MADNFPRVLVISNNALSATDSNGRTLGNFFRGWNKQAIAQFYLQDTQPDWLYCNRFYRVTDHEVLALFKGARTAGGPLFKEETATIGVSDVNRSVSKPKRNAFSMLVRDFVWRHSSWRAKGFNSWVKEFSPELILLQAGDFPYFYDLAVDVAQMSKAPLIIFNTESYIFKDFDYFRSRGIPHWFFFVFQRKLRRSVVRAYDNSVCNIFSCEELLNEYNDRLGVNGTVLYTSTNVAVVDKHESDTFVLSYCGNLGIGRHESLIEVGKALQEISSDLHVDVYGKAPSKEVIQALEAAPGVQYHGFVSYEKVRSIISQSDVLVHVESFEPFYVEDLRYGFSTKIADYLASGICFLLYAPDSLACSRYVQRNNVAYLVSSQNQLRKLLDELYRNPSIRTLHRDMALKTASENHDTCKNALKFQSLIKETLNCAHVSTIRKSQQQC